VRIEEIAARVLEISVRKRVSLRLAASEFFSQYRQYEKLKPAVRVITTEVARRYKLLDRATELVLGIDTEKLDLYAQNLVRVVVFEVMYRDFPLSTFSWFCRKFRVSISALRRLRDTDPDELVRGLDYISRLSVKYSIPRWVIDELFRAKIPNVEELLARFMRDPTRYIRVSTHLTDPEELAERLAQYGILCSRDPDLPDLLRIERYETHPAKTKEYERGLYHIQDKSSVLLGHEILQDLREGKCRMIDVTGGPGGKITHVAQYGYYSVGVDLSLRRVREIERHVKRMHILLTDYLCADSTKIPIRLEKFDVVLVDPECSGIGRLHHNPEAKMWISRRDVEKHSKLQYMLLRAVLARVRKGTVIYYCTCTLTLQENENQVMKILEEFDIEVVKPEPFLGAESPILRNAQRLYPHVHDTTGFFIAKLVKL